MAQTQWNIHGALGLVPSSQAFLQTTLQSAQRAGITNSTRYHQQMDTNVSATRHPGHGMGDRGETGPPSAAVVFATTETTRNMHNATMLQAVVKLTCANRLAEKKAGPLRPIPSVREPASAGRGAYNPMVAASVQPPLFAHVSTKLAGRSEWTLSSTSIHSRGELAIDIALHLGFTDEQMRAYFTVTDHMNMVIAHDTRECEQSPEQLTVYIGGPAGTGKSWILHGWREYLAALGLTDVSVYCTRTHTSSVCP
jgi:hypothetical protein